MKNMLKKSFVMASAGLVAVSVVGCKKDDKVDQPSAEVEKYEEMSLDNYKLYLLGDWARLTDAVGKVDSFAEDKRAGITKALADGITAVNDAADKPAALKAFNDSKAALINALPKADGIKSYVGLSRKANTKILGQLESYAIRNGITGISLFENGGHVMYNERVQLGTQNYIPGYGFGTVTEGKLTADLETEKDPRFKRYFHEASSVDPQNINGLDASGNDVLDLYGNVASGFYGTYMNKTKDGYDWVPILAKEMPIPVDPQDGAATTWKFRVKVGAEAKYNINTADDKRKAYDGREIALEDYESAFKILLTKKNGFFRGAELAGNKDSGIVGAKAYFDATTNGYNDEAWEKVGIKTEVVTEGTAAEKGNWFQVEFLKPMSLFDARYTIASSLYQPIPQSFFDLVTENGKNPKLYGSFNSDKTMTPADNILSTGPFTTEVWDTDKLITFKKNPYYVDAETKYQVAGIHQQILKGAATDQNLIFKEFLAGKLDSSSIPQDYLKEYANDKRTKKTTGDSVFKLNVNATDAATWEKLFGENGSVVKTAKEDYWEVEPALANAHFVQGLNYSIDRDAYAAKRGSIASVNYLSSNYMSDPENGISYSMTQEHKDAVKWLLNGTTNGYSLTLAREYFKMAVDEMVAEGVYEPGTKENPTIINLEMAWFFPAQKKTHYAEISSFFETAFNHVSVSDGKFKLTCDFWVSDDPMNTYDEKLLVGQYDIGFGSISGNALNPLSFMDVLSSDPKISHNFTLNWGTDTNDPNVDVLVYDGLQWSYDALWKAGNGTAIVVDGALINILKGAETTKSTVTEAGDLEVEISIGFNNGEGYEGQLAGVVLYGYTKGEEDYIEEEIEIVQTPQEDGSIKITLTVPAATWNKYKGHANVGFDVYYNEVINGKPTMTATGVPATLA